MPMRRMRRAARRQRGLVNLQGFSEELSLSCRDLQALFHREDVPEAVRRRGRALLDRDIAESILSAERLYGDGSDSEQPFPQP